MLASESSTQQTRESSLSTQSWQVGLKPVCRPWPGRALKFLLILTCWILGTCKPSACKLHPKVKAGPLPVCVNEVLLEHCHSKAHSFMHFLWLLSCYNGGTGVVVIETIWPAKSKIFSVRFLIETNSCHLVIKFPSFPPSCLPGHEGNSSLSLRGLCG